MSSVDPFQNFLAVYCTSKATPGDYLHDEKVVDVGLQIIGPDIHLFRQNSLASEVFLIQDGLVKIVRFEKSGAEVIIGLRFSGSSLGSAAVLSQSPHPFSAVTVTTCRAIRIKTQAFIDLVHNDNRVAGYIHERHSLELLDMAVHVSQSASVSAQQRLEQLLWRLAREENGAYTKGTKLRLPLKYWEIAELLAITPGYLSKLFGALEHKGILQRDRGWIIVKNPQNLWHEARECSILRTPLN